MHSSSTDVDELIETEVCNRLISLSCAKMVNSKNERGGAKLRRNLLILHLLRRARSEQHRPPAVGNGYINLSPPEECVEGATVVFNGPVVQCQDSCSGVYAHTGEQLIYGSGAGMPYYDYMNNGGMKNGNVYCDPVVDTLSGDGGASPGLILSDNMTQHLQYENNRLQVQVKYGNAGSANDSGLVDGDDSNTEIPLRFPLSVPVSCSVYDSEPCTYQQQQHHLPSCISPDAEADDDEEASSYESDTSSSDGGEADVDSETCDSDSLRHQRKRKTSMSSLQTCPSSTPKKCCVEERQFTGLMSVFNSELSVVADQLLPATAPEPLLQTPSDQLVPPLVRIPCNPLIC